MRHIQTGIALVCVLLLNISGKLTASPISLLVTLPCLTGASLTHTAQPGRCSLAAYSETRSFRDALDGRSMEEAISGPVDKDTSSYGDRTSSSASPNSNGAGSSQSSTNGSPMMLTIPANGNLNSMMAGQQQQTTDAQEQEKSSNGDSDLEREAGPINGLPMDTQQQMMEQKAARQTRGQPMSGRLSAPAMLMMMMNSPSSAPKSARQQQQQQETDYGSQSTGSEPGFGEESTGGVKQPGSSMPSGKGAPGEQSPSYGKSNGSGQPKLMNGMGGGNYGGADEQQQQQSSGSPVEQQQQSDQQEKGYGESGADQQVAAKQRAMAAMLMSMNTNGMRYARPNSPAMAGASMANGQYGDKKPSSMAQNMIMSLANKAAYQQQQQQQQRSQRQMAPPMMMMMGAMGANGKNQVAGNGYGQMNGGGNMMSAMLAANGNGMRGGMRRANQRLTEKKMSPAMVNAMLNKMMSAKQQEKDGGANGAGYMKPAAMAMMMKSPAGAEMLANMMMPQMSSAMAGLPAAKRDQYKRMMMDAIMQQSTSGESDYNAQDQQQQSMAGDSYGSQQMAPKNGGYGPKGMMNRMNGGKQGGSGYDMGEQQKQMGAEGYGQQKKGAGAGDYEGQQQEQQQQQRQPMDGAKGYEQQQQMMMMPGMGPASGAKSPMGARSAGKMPMAAAAYPPSSGSSMMDGAKGGKYGGDEGAGMEQRKQMGQGYDMDQQQQRESSPMSPGTKSGSGNGGYSSTEAGPAMDMMQMQAPMMGAAKMGSPMSFRQAYSQQSMEKNGYQAPASGTKSMSGGEGSYGSPMSAARPMQTYEQGADTQQQQQDEYGSAPMGQAEPFAFDYKIEDDYGNGQYRKEESDKNGVVRGSYGYTDVSGIYRHVEYVADENGFRANIKSNEPGLSSEGTKSAGSGANSLGQAMQTMQTMEPASQSAMADGGSGNTQQQQMQYSGQSQMMSDSAKKA